MSELVDVPIPLSIEVCVDGQAPKNNNNYICRVSSGDSEISIDPHILGNFCFDILPPHGLDLIVLAGAVAYADRLVRRRMSEGWSRSIRLIVPVYEIDLWRVKAVAQALRDALHFVSGDNWEFDFVSRPDRSGLSGQRSLPYRLERSIVLPFSNGLDSYAGLQLLKHQDPERTTIRVTAWNRSLSHNRVPDRKCSNLNDIRAPIPIRIHAGRNAEPSFRTRTFLYKVFAGLAAFIAKSEAVVIPESGQGGIGPSLVPFGAEWPHRGSHPGFTKRLEILFREIFGWHVPFIHPNLSLTKGEVLAQLKEHGIQGQWAKTMSCVRDSRWSVLSGTWVHCGVCSGCILRRVALHSAKYDSSSEIYLWPDLNAERLELALDRKSDRKTKVNDRDIASHAILSMNELAQYASEIDDFGLECIAYDVAGPRGRVGIADIEILRNLLDTHRKEWHSFLDLLRPSSWVRGIARVN